MAAPMSRVCGCTTDTAAEHGGTSGRLGANSCEQGVACSLGLREHYLNELVQFCNFAAHVPVTVSFMLTRLHLWGKMQSLGVSFWGLYLPLHVVLVGLWPAGAT